MSVLKVPDMFSTIQDAIDSWQKGDVIRVAQGNYTENLRLKPGVILEGGFRSDFSAQNWEQWPSVIDGNQRGSVVIGAEGAQLNGFTLRNGQAKNGGGIFVEKLGMTIKNNLIEDNVAEYDGGGIYIAGYLGVARSGIYFDIFNNVIRKNKATGVRGGWGGGICVRDAKAGIRITNNTIGGKLGEGNRAFASGGGVSVLDTPILEVEANTISQNLTDGHGGGIVISGGSGNFSIRKNKIHYNAAYGNYGGGIFAIGDVHISCNDIKGNMVDNKGLAHGGGIAAHGYEHHGPMIENNFIYGNWADYGGGIQVDRIYRLVIINNSIAFNKRNPDLPAAGGVHIEDGLCILQNNIIWGHNDDLRVVAGKTILIHNNIEDGDGFGNLGNISSDPKFVAYDDLHIKANSGSIHGGDPKGAPREDIDGQRRSPTTPDIGADEFSSKE